MLIEPSTVLVTGGNSGIGKELAGRLHGRGHRVVVAGRREDALAKVVDAHPGLEHIVLDQGDPASIAECRGIVDARYPDLNVLVNSAGVIMTEDLTDPADLVKAEDTIGINLLGPIRLTSALLPVLRGKPGATIITLSSGLGFVPRNQYATYCASKAALHSYVQSLRVQVAPLGVDVVEVIPPGVQTEMMGDVVNPAALPVGTFVDQVLDILDRPQHDREICVEAVHRLRFAEARGDYDEIYAGMNG